MSIQHHLELERFVLQRLPDLTGKHVLDLGCGKELLGYLCRQSKGGDTAWIVGADIWIPYLDFCSRFGAYDYLVQIDGKDQLPFHEGWFDVVLACEVLHHLPRTAGDQLLDELEPLARECLILTCPNGNQLRGPVDSVPVEAHVFVWHTRDFRSRGYEVRVLGFRFQPGNGRLALALWYAATPLATRLPRLADCLIAYRSTDPSFRQAFA